MTRLVLEFAGLPGAGKSTVAAEVVKLLERRGLCVTGDPLGRTTGRVTRIGLLAYLAARPVFVLRSFVAILRTRQPSIRDLLWTTWTWLKRTARVSRALRQPGLQIFEPGIGQALWSIGLRARAPSFPLLAEGLLERSPRPDFIALIDADNETVISRLRERAGSTSRLEQSDLGPDALVTARRRLREVVTALARLEVPPRVQRIVNDREYAAPACAVAIVDWLADNCDLSALEVRT